MDLLPWLKPYVRHCGDSRRKAWHIGPRTLLDYLIVFIADGQGRFSLDGKATEVGPDDLFWVPPGIVHDMEGFPPSMHCVYVHFDLIYRPAISHWDFTIPGGTLDLSPYQPLMHPQVTHPLLHRLNGPIRSPTNARVGRILQNVCAEAARGQPFAGLIMSSLMQQAIAEILRGMEGLPPEHMTWIPAIERVAAAMRSRCHESFPVRRIARDCNLSESHFRSLFSAHFGYSPRGYLRRARISCARELMVGSSLSISEIATRVGFGSIHSLTRAFKDIEGVPPTSYRRCASVKTRVEGRPVPYSI